MHLFSAIFFRVPVIYSNASSVLARQASGTLLFGLKHVTFCEFDFQYCYARLCPVFIFILKYSLRAQYTFI